ncbi:cytochrome C oxidase subunit IV family protein [Frankia sp. CNm7]|uniref:Cytochrome C oxidase subunit IV family protein n=1 Tax=Frankia nepalensis TaxID=1836974 RepID=A0A937UP41_9ACTN|nr:cytochrome C oxidase subunit IV family protein [Frankia nepalensis]MBL7497175.1 cytochrome C oxidase subunit IV family protein [Frankia nepalensis]MBL7513117.1 cytochrome C oxidase subunit IV family protein [Frankia nepalensis]MBL7518332.1 cytochrome C oxidase subunit IV family protein [Frankia nepalensis]MBL7626880.1 cytochrome C oxidase subunit IV family protein [Frankia nepalensis]
MKTALNKKTAIDKRLLAVWAVLSAITLIYLWIDRSADDGGAPTASTAVTVSAIILALVKVRIIMREFMEVRHAPALLRRLTDLWVVLMAASLLGMYFVGKAVA